MEKKFAKTKNKIGSNQKRCGDWREEKENAPYLNV